jgi:hypothetical protein
MDCRQFFEQHAQTSEVCKALQMQAEADQLAWERQKASPHSPAPVDDEEFLCRQVVDPTHYDCVSGSIKPTFFDDASSRGASCHRLSYTSDSLVHQMTLARVHAYNTTVSAAVERQAIGYAVMSAASIRSIRASSTGRRGVGIYDTAKPDDPSHADVCQLVSGKQDGKSIRAQLWELAKGGLKRFDAPPQTSRLPEP